MSSLTNRDNFCCSHFLYKNISLLIFSFVIFFCFIKCGGEQKGHIKDNSELIRVSFSSNKESVVSDSIINDISYIKLEDTEESIGLVRKIIIENNKIIIWDDAKKSIWIFSINGKFLGRISQFGHSDEKYASIYNISFVEPNIVNVIDGESKSIKSYTINGKFLSKEKTEGNVSDYIFHHNKKFWFYYYRYNQLFGKHHFSVQEVDKSKIGFFEYQKPFLFVGNGGDYLLKSNDIVYLRRPYNDTIFSYQNKVLTAKYIFDFGKNAYPTTEIYNAKNIQQVDSITSKETYEGNISNLLISKNYLLLTFNQQKGSDDILTSILIRNLRTGKTITYRYLEGRRGKIVPNYPMATDGESFYSLHTSSELADSVKRLKKSTSNLESNPIIIKYNYKV